jgi:hypothetical protein
VPQIATVGRVAGFWAEGAIGTQEEPAGFRRKIRYWRGLCQAGGTKTTDIRAQREVVWKTALSVRAKKGRENVIFLQDAVRLSERFMAAVSHLQQFSEIISPPTAPSPRPDNVNGMRNPAPINHFPPTLFSPNRSPLYGEAHLFSQPESPSGLPSWVKTLSRPPVDIRRLFG